MALILSVIYASGGQAKTTTVEFLAEVYKTSGYNVLTVDLEPQHSLSNYYQADIKNKPTLTDVLLGQTKTRNAIQHTDKGDILPCTRLLAAVEEISGRKKYENLGKWEQLAKVLDEVEDDYEVIIIDTPTELRFFSINAALASDGIIIPVDPKKFEIETYRETVDTLVPVLTSSMRKGRIYGAFMTKVTKGRVLTRETAEALEQVLNEDGLRLLPSISTCEEISKAQAHKNALLKQAPRCEAVADFVRLATAIMDEYRKDIDDEREDE